jgi:tRNA (Thr-GGU) A37 N-methylase
VRLTTTVAADDSESRKRKRADHAALPSARPSADPNVSSSSSSSFASAASASDASDLPLSRAMNHIRVSKVELKPIGVFESCWPEKYGAPRQGALVAESRGAIELTCYQGARHAALEGLEEFSHVVVLWLFHDNRDKRTEIVPDAANKDGNVIRYTSEPAAKVQPPRLSLASKRKIGVFATRTPHRPAPIGLTICRIEKVQHARGRVIVSGIDLIDKTPILDIKPYVPRYDSFPLARTPAWITPVGAVSDEAANAGAHVPETEMEAAASASCALGSLPSAVMAASSSEPASSSSSSSSSLSSFDSASHSATKTVRVEISAEADADLLRLAPRLRLFRNAPAACRACIVATLGEDIRSRHEKQRGPGTYGFCIDVLNCVFEVTVDGGNGGGDGDDSGSGGVQCKVLRIEHWPQNFDHVRSKPHH